ncbi:hypothetical protein N9B82_06520, partial [Saprospiraceae bacterium]|nr:hypothetical protein [Saprospiraceae bacterium]
MNFSLEIILLLVIGIANLILIAILLKNKNTSNSDSFRKLIAESNIQQDQLIRTEFKNNRESLD